MSKYSRGADFERAVVKHLEKEGYLAFRCAGSKGNSKVDVIAIARDEKGFMKTHLIQCKLNGAISKSEKRTICQAAAEFLCIPILASKTNGSLHLDVIKEGDIKG